MHPRLKWLYFEEQWRANTTLRAYLTPTKAKIKRLWETTYKTESTPRTERSPSPDRNISYIERILNKRAPAASYRPTRSSPRRDQLI